MRILLHPHDWRPQFVNNPECPGYCFTEAGAWALIADQLEAGHPFEEIKLDVPRGEPAVVMLINLEPTQRPLYVKVQIGPRIQAIGRSFHYSYH